MKRKLLLAALCVVGALGFKANAQTDVYKDVTSTYLTNADFEGSYSVMENSGVSSDRAIYQPEGWTITYNPKNTNDLTSLNSSCLQWTQFSSLEQLSNGGSNTYWVRQIWGNNQILELSQNVVLPIGTYTLSAMFYKGGSGGDGYIFVGNTTATKDNGTSWAKVSVENFTSDGDEIKVGFVAKHTWNGSAKLLGYDDFVLQWNLTKSLSSLITSATEVYNEDTSNTVLKAAIDEAATHTSSTDADELETAYNTLADAASLVLKWKAWKEAKTAAQTAIDNSDYVNVTGTERTALQAEIDKDEPSTADGYDTAREALVTATSAFTTAKTNYDALVTTKTDAATYTTEAWPYASAAKKTALDEAVNVTATSSEDAATKAAAITTAIRQFVESNGNAEGVDVAVDYTSSLLVYDATVSTSGWTSGTIGTNQGQSYTDGNGATVNKYFDGGWSASAGVNITLTQSLTLPAGDYLLQITARGASGLTSYTMSVGETSVDLPCDAGSGGTFGNGWSDKYLTFTSTGEAVTLTIAAASTETQQWISFNRLRLHKLDATLADASDYEALNAAISAAEGKTLGFGEGQYAPYENVDALKLLAAAKAIDQTVSNEQEAVQELTANLNNATWTANTTDVDAIYNGLYATVTEGKNYPDGWARTNGWGQMQSGLSGDYATAYYNQPGSLKYGDTGVYTMPLAANTWYKLTFAYRSHENNSNNKVTVSVLNGEDGLAATEFPKNGSTTEWKVAEKYFTTGAAGNYVLTLANDGNTWMTGVSLVKETPANIVKTSSANLQGYKTFYNAEFNYEVDENTDIYIAAAPNNGYVSLTKVDADRIIPAGTPVILKTANQYDITLTPTAATSSNDFSANVLKVATSTGVINGAYILAYTKADGLGFYNYTGSLDAGDVYLTATAGSNVRLSIVADGETTGIAGVDAEAGKDTEAIYNMAGQRVDGSYKGIVIKNGKKYMIK